MAGADLSNNQINMTRTPNKKKIREILKSRKAIVIDNKFIKKVLAFDDMRDFAQSIGDWGYTTDFTYRDYQTNNWQAFVRRYLKENFID